MQIATYKDWEEYKTNKLASKQADRLYKELVALKKRKASSKQYQEVYSSYFNTNLYQKHGALYCQVLSDVNRG